jgi:multidrug efflux pump subunit AcrB
MIRFFANHPTAANLLMLIFVAMGLFSIRSLRRETLPDFAASEVLIRIAYPGATPEEVEEAVCQRVEDALDGVKYVEELRCDAREGVAIITVEMEEDGDYLTFKDEIDTEVNAITDFPSDVEDPIITELGTTDRVMAVLVSGPVSPPQLKAYCEDLKDRLQELPEVSLVELYGFSDHQFRIELSSDALMRFNLSVAQVAEVVGRQSVDLPAGAIETRDRDILVRFVEQRRNITQLEDLVVITGRQGGEVRLGDIGNVEDLFELDEDKVLLGDSRAGVLQIEKTKTQDTVRVARAVKSFIQKEQERRPNVEIRITDDSSTLVVDRLNLLVKNGWQGLILVFLTMWLFFNIRLSFWVMMTLPVSFLGAFFFLPQLDLTINMLTMVGLLLALGLLVDAGVVIADNVATHVSAGKPSLQAAVDGTGEVKGGVISSFITTVCILGPLMFLEGNMGKVLLVVPIALILVLSVNLADAFFVLPSHLVHSLKGYQAGRISAFRRRFEKAIDWTREYVLGRAVDVLLKWRYLWIGTVVFLFLFSISMLVGGFLKFRAFPDLEGDVVVARVLMPQGTPLEKTEDVVRQVTAGMDRVNERFTPLQPGGAELVRTVYVQFNQNIDALENGPHVATVTVELLGSEDRNARIDDVLAAWREETGDPPDVISLVLTDMAIGPAGRAIETRLQGRDLDRLKVAATQMHAWLSRFEGLYNLADDLRPGKEEVRLRLRDGPLGLQLDAANIALQLRAAFHGITADEIQVGPESYEIDVRLDRGSQNSLADLEYFHLTTPSGKLVPLGAVAEVEAGRGWSRVARVNGMRTVTVRGDVDARLANVADIISELEGSFLPEFLEEHPGISVSVEGETKESAKTQASMMRAMLIGLVGVFVLLSFQFRSYLEPLIVMLAIPFTLIGVIWGHMLMGIQFSMPSIFGFISLAGVAVNNSILLVLFLKMRRQEGADVLESAAGASRHRFRAITITSFTTVAGLLPLLTERSLQAQVLIPLAVSVAFGLMASTLLVLLVIPCIYTALADFGLVGRFESEEEKSCRQ